MNNILSTDSISPAALYPRRKTGNKRFFPVVACPSDEVIFLYSKIPSYKVSDGGMENYRVVIALDADKIGQQIRMIGSKHKVDVHVRFRRNKVLRIKLSIFTATNKLNTV